MLRAGIWVSVGWGIGVGGGAGVGTTGIWAALVAVTKGAYIHAFCPW